MPLRFLQQSPSSRIQALSQTLEVESMMVMMSELTRTPIPPSCRWADTKELFEYWIRSLDRAGKPNKPDVNIYNHYLRANLMTNAMAADLLDLVAQMEEQF
ncbi:pentatricopeptide repeat-containing protein, mitochondrial, partial [Fagus crenata]